MRCLVTGAAGFVGSHLSDAMRFRGDEVDEVDVVNGPQFDALDFFRTDNTRFDLAIHCAAVIGGRAGIDGTPLAVATNLALDAWYFNWLIRTGTPRAVYFSSSACYPTWLQSAELAAESGFGPSLSEDMIDLNDIRSPDAVYGLTKLVGEQLAEHARAAGCRVLVMRPFSGYGPRQSHDYPFPSLIRRAQLREDPFEIWGDGNQVRDWIHVSDLVNAVLAALDAGEDGPVNLGTGRATSFNELAAMVIAQVGGGYDPAIRRLTDKPTGVAYRVADITRMNKAYTARIALEEGIADALALTWPMD